MAWAPNLWLALLWSFLVGVGGAGFITAANAISQQESPSDMRSRLMALQAVAFLGTTPIGGPITGWVADAVERAHGPRVRRGHQPGVCGWRVGVPAAPTAEAGELEPVRRSTKIDSNTP